MYEILINFHSMWVSFQNTNATNRLDQEWKISYQHSWNTCRTETNTNWRCV